MKYRWVILLLLIPFFSLSQNNSIDSLKRSLSSLKETSRIDCLNSLSNAYAYLQNDTAKMYANAAFKEASAINYKRGMGRAINSLTIIDGKCLGNNFLMKQYSRQAIQIFNQSTDSIGLAEAYRNLGYCYYAGGFWDSSLQYCNIAKKLSEKIGDMHGLAGAFLLSGFNYTDGGYYDKAFENYNESYRKAAMANDDKFMSHSLAAIGELYDYAGDHRTALTYYFQSLQHAKGFNILWHPLGDIGDAYFLLKQYDSAMFYQQQYIRTIESLSNDPATLGFKVFPNLSVAELYIERREYDKAMPILQYHLPNERGQYLGTEMRILLDIEKIYVGKKDFNSAFKYGRELLQIAAKTNQRQYLRDGNQLMFIMYDQLKKTDSAYFYYRLYMDMKDSMAIDQFGKKLILYKAATDDKQKATQIELLKQVTLNSEQRINIQQAELERKSLMLSLSIGVLVVGLLISILAIRNSKLKKKKEQLQKLILQTNIELEGRKKEQRLVELEKEKAELEMLALRAQMNPHFIFNCLSSINRFILINNTEAASSYLTKFSRLIRMALQHSEKSMITLEKELEMLRHYLDLERLRFKNAFDYSITFINTIDTATIFVPPLIFQPFAENAIWHGLMHKKGMGYLDIALSIEGKILTSIITDNGIGRTEAALLKSKTAEKDKSMGMKITVERLALLNKTIDQQSFFDIEDIKDKEGNTSGTKVELKIQYRNMVEAFD